MDIPTTATLLHRVGERIADEIEAVAAGRQSHCRLAAKDIHALYAEAIQERDREVIEALDAADCALAQFTAFEEDARYIMGNTNYEIVKRCHERIKAILAKAGT
jgi:hypothetical protein